MKFTVIFLSKNYASSNIFFFLLYLIECRHLNSQHLQILSTYVHQNSLEHTTDMRGIYAFLQFLQYTISKLQTAVHITAHKMGVEDNIFSALKHRRLHEQQFSITGKRDWKFQILALENTNW